MILTPKEKMMYQNSYRHGDLVLVEVEKLPKDLEPTNTDVILEGKTNTHRIVKGKIYFKEVDMFVFGYLEAFQGAYLTHPEHGEGKSKVLKAPIEPGFYELRRQQEETHEGMKQVED